MKYNCNYIQEIVNNYLKHWAVVRYFGVAIYDSYICTSCSKSSAHKCFEYRIWLIYSNDFFQYNSSSWMLTIFVFFNYYNLAIIKRTYCNLTISTIMISILRRTSKSLEYFSLPYYFTAFKKSKYHWNDIILFVRRRGWINIETARCKQKALQYLSSSYW